MRPSSRAVRLRPAQNASVRPDCFLNFGQVRVSSYNSEALLGSLRVLHGESTGAGLNIAGNTARDRGQGPEVPGTANKAGQRRRKVEFARDVVSRNVVSKNAVIKNVVSRNLSRERVDSENWEADGQAEPYPKALTHEQVKALRALHPPISPWRVVGVQALVGLAAALILALFTGKQIWVWSFLYGAATVVVPGALMARGITSPLARKSAGAGVISFLVWETVKVGVAVAMLLLAPVVVQPLSWPALLAGLVLCLKCYWVALLWRGSNKN